MPGRYTTLSAALVFGGGLFRGVLVVRTTAQPDPIDVMRMRPRESVEVIELEPTGLRAPPAAIVRERAAPSS